MSRGKLRAAPFALRIVRRTDGDAAIIYRRMSGGNGGKADQLLNIGAIAPLAYTAATPLLRAAGKAATGRDARLVAGPAVPLDYDWGARLACFARLSAGLRDGGRLARAARAIQDASGTEAAWWLGLIERDSSSRAVRALRILTEATA